MSMFKKTNVKIFAKPAQKVTPDTLYWNKFSVPVLLKEFGPIDYIDFSPTEPHYFAVTSTLRVQVYNGITKGVDRSYSRFKSGAFGGKFRQDGRLLCAGSVEAELKLFDVNSKSLLRTFSGHTGPIHRCLFTTDQVHIASFSDDNTACLWDIPTEKKLYEFDAHKDYVRAGCVCEMSDSLLVSGGYDGKVQLYDTRTGSTPHLTMDHGAPVEALLLLPSGGVVISAGGTEVRLWDALCGGRLLARLSHHHKTITSLCLASNGSRLLSASLDKHVKIYDIPSYKVVHNIDYPSPILSLAISNNDETLAVGMVDGLVSVSRRELVGESLETVRGGGAKDSVVGRVAPSGGARTRPEGKEGQSKADAHLRSFDYAKALDCVLVPYVVNKQPHQTVAILNQLIRRKGLERVLATREPKSLVTLIKFIIKYIGDYRFTSTLIDVSNILLDGCTMGETWCGSGEVTEVLKRLRLRLREEEELGCQLLKLGGALELLLNAATPQHLVAR